jgi:hypothetical protein
MAEVIWIQSVLQELGVKSPATRCYDVITWVQRIGLPTRRSMHK